MINGPRKRIDKAISDWSLTQPATCKIARPCAACACQIQPGERYRNRATQFDPYIHDFCFAALVDNFKKQDAEEEKERREFKAAFTPNKHGEYQ